MSGVYITVLPVMMLPTGNMKLKKPNTEVEPS